MTNYSQRYVTIWCNKASGILKLFFYHILWMWILKIRWFHLNTLYIQWQNIRTFCQEIHLHSLFLKWSALQSRIWALCKLHVSFSLCVLKHCKKSTELFQSYKIVLYFVQHSSPREDGDREKVFKHTGIFQHCLTHIEFL